MSAYNLLVHHGRLIMIDLPQVVDVMANPRGAEFLDRDATNIARWFSAHGLDSTAPQPRGPARPAAQRSRHQIMPPSHPGKRCLVPHYG
jgi:serine/threonine-protein kinase RIO1